ncbi:MAG: hypothetical protein Q7T28_16440 [Cypionkella sp.]|nr:hypothetical protein [Cypionkella sp.]MDO8328515.1 hypothetical protein [Cypionkella sp.]
MDRIIAQLAALKAGGGKRVVDPVGVRAVARQDQIVVFFARRQIIAAPASQRVITIKSRNLIITAATRESSTAPPSII